MTQLETKLNRLLKDFHYEVQGNRIIQKGIPGVDSDRIFGTCRSVMDACEQLIPIIREDEFRDRYIQLTTPED